ncbi:hypothetical protein [Gimesia sp.]|uniref:hypothetical protein n=1 Tax=Gimesia sp. TaxID=2024833 RepID=UPI003A923A17
MKLAEQMPTFTRWYQTIRRLAQRYSQRLAAIPRMPYFVFLVAAVIATSIVPIVFPLLLAGPVIILVSTPICLPVLAGNLTLLYWNRRQTLVRPSLLLRLLILALVMEGFFLICRYRNPPEVPELASTEALIFMWLYGGQCILLLILEPGLRWWQRRRLAEKTESFFSHPLS